MHLPLNCCCRPQATHIPCHTSETHRGNRSKALCRSTPVQHSSNSPAHTHQCHTGHDCTNSPTSHGHQHRANLRAGVLGTCTLIMQGAMAHAEEGVSALATSVGPMLIEGSKYTPSPYEPGWEIWVGFLAGVIPFAIGSYEFGKRILIQQRCELCAGKGLVTSTNQGAKYLRKCPQCGGFFPWISWKMFLTSNATPGNGGPLQQPKGQKSVFYEVPASMPTREQVDAARARYIAQSAARGGAAENEQQAGQPSRPGDGADQS